VSFVLDDGKATTLGPRLRGDDNEEGAVRALDDDAAVRARVANAAVRALVDETGVRALAGRR
jgi:hypothetical protein